MKILICGAGRATRALLAHMGGGWSVTVIDSRANLDGLLREFESVQRVFTGDASSPVVLERAGLAGHDWVVAFTPDDEVNLAVVRFAKQAGVRHIVGRVVDPGRRSAMEQSGARTFSDIGALSRDVMQFLRNPRVRVVPVARERGDIIEMEVAPRSSIVGKTPTSLRGETWRLAAIFRDGHMHTPDEDLVFREGDILIAVGPPDQIGPMCSLLECSETDFPRAYGNGVLLALIDDDVQAHRALLSECMHLVQATMIELVSILGGQESAVARESATTWAGRVDIELLPQQEKPYAQVESACAELNPGLVIVPRQKASRLGSLVRRTPMNLARTLPCPLLVANGVKEYKRILVPFNGTGNSRLALEIAAQLAGRLGAAVTVVVVREPAFMHSEEEDQSWVETALERARELARGRETSIAEIVRDGNPVLEIVALAEDYDLLVLGGGEPGGLGIFTPDVSEHIVGRAPCSVLVITG